MKLLIFLFKGLRKSKNIAINIFYTPIAKIIFYLNGIHFGKNLDVNGLMKVDVTRRGIVNIGDNFRLNSGDNFNVIGRQQKSIFWVEGKLTIKDNVGMSSIAIICNHEITIGNHVIMGGNTVIYDTDFHSLDAEQRKTKGQDKINALSAPVTIEDNVFIGAHSTLLKGVTIGKNSIIGACSVVVKSIPANEIWAGNPAKFIRKVK